MPPTPFFSLLDNLEALNHEDKYSAFHIIQATYKSSADTGSHITADILIPHTLRNTAGPGPRPVVVRIHGGFLVTGSGLYPPWFNSWILEYALANQAIIISPNYRLLPEVSGREILDDIHDFWHWLRNGSVVSIIQEKYRGVALNHGSTLVVGESAGGYLAVQLAISYPSQIRGVIAAYPMVDLRSRFYRESYSKPIVGVANVPVRVVNDHLATLTQESQRPWVTAANPPDRLELAFAITQNGRYLEVFGSADRELFPMERIEDLLSNGEKVRLPPMFILHGEQDSAVPVESSKKFVRFLREKLPQTTVMLYTQDGDHGFDAEATLETPWLQKRLDIISQVWLEPSSAHL
ncbi:alpha/beta-hydrolase [Aspergillus avenaceus]|uniref:Alpha/beta-hydrolase n=1 Tax=Aspergillus avenaceus TaxID=36643 RepID=A0A5N6TP41_ASPAV|nr:alpha/beta-hydrolase [Aspergillus avenaceus]